MLERRFAEVHIGHYDVLDLLGKGGMGTVYKARHRHMKRVVAIKVLAREVACEPWFVQRFQREIETVAQLMHPHIVMAYDAAEDAIGHYLVMEYVNGRDLASEVLQDGPLSIADAVDCTLQAARGLEFAHRQGIIHRDVKPANLLRDASGVVKVADLGLARLSAAPAGSSLTQVGDIVGTADFMPPEQAFASAPVDHRADIYSLGCTLFFLIAGRPPYQAEVPIGVLLQHREAPLPSLAAVRPDTPPELDALQRRALAKQPADRYPTMTAMVHALEAMQRLTVALTARPGLPPPVDPSTGLPNSETDHAAALSDTQATPAAAAPRRLEELTIVLVEPSRTQAGIVRTYLRELGIDKVHATGAGRQALALARETHADVVLSAMHLTDMTGLQLLQALRTDTVCAGLGFILASSATGSDATEELPREPRTVLMPKPFDVRKLAQALAQASRAP